MATTTPAQTPVAWSTFATGTNPGGHGIFDFIRRDPRTYLPDLAQPPQTPPHTPTPTPQPAAAAPLTPQPPQHSQKQQQQQQQGQGQGQGPPDTSAAASETSRPSSPQARLESVLSDIDSDGDDEYLEDASEDASFFGVADLRAAVEVPAVPSQRAQGTAYEKQQQQQAGLLSPPSSRQSREVTSPNPLDEVVSGSEVFFSLFFTLPQTCPRLSLSLPMLMHNHHAHITRTHHAHRSRLSMCRCRCVQRRSQWRPTNRKSTPYSSPGCSPTSRWRKTRRRCWTRTPWCG